MSIFKKKKPIIRLAHQNVHIFTQHDKDRIRRLDGRTVDINAKLHLLADSLGLVFLKHDKFGTHALINKEALKSKLPKYSSDVPTEGEETESGG